MGMGAELWDLNDSPDQTREAAEMATAGSPSTEKEDESENSGSVVVVEDDEAVGGGSSSRCRIFGFSVHSAGEMPGAAKQSLEEQPEALVTHQFFPVPGDRPAGGEAGAAPAGLPLPRGHLVKFSQETVLAAGVAAGGVAMKKSRRGPRSRSSQYRGVTFYRRTGRWESHIWFVFLSSDLPLSERRALNFPGIPVTRRTLID